MFEQLFTRLEQTIPGLRSVSVVGEDGIEVESHAPHASFPMDVLGAEMNGILRTMERLQKESELGKPTEVCIRTRVHNVMLYDLAGGVFLLVVTEPFELTGRVRFEVQRLLHEFTAVLS